MNEYEVGSEVIYSGKTTGPWYPPIGTIGKVIYGTISSSIKMPIIEWPEGSTQSPGRWACDEWLVKPMNLTPLQLYEDVLIK